MYQQDFQRNGPVCGSFTFLNRCGAVFQQELYHNPVNYTHISLDVAVVVLHYVCGFQTSMDTVLIHGSGHL